ncbi:hypothetical protein CC78DRAFT_577987 [Lojkania enalia]|uniref:Uncharacterized protein n=1 Tax=Lojkania enalia TaxID=147567 RepID=A0A9P4KI34_9PLEO|nr:hypothetical protein CC78DRAFT_577987 [Didymosphaeria enalia]
MLLSERSACLHSSWVEEIYMVLHPRLTNAQIKLTREPGSLSANGLLNPVHFSETTVSSASRVDFPRSCEYFSTDDGPSLPKAYRNRTDIAIADPTRTRLFHYSQMVQS